jgi:hypothetical protein
MGRGVGVGVTHKSWSRNGHKMVTNCQGLAGTGCDGLTPLTPLSWYGEVFSGTGRYRPKQALYNSKTEGD